MIWLESQLTRFLVVCPSLNMEIIKVANSQSHWKDCTRACKVLAECLAPSKLSVSSGCYWCYHHCYWWCLCQILLITSKSFYILEKNWFFYGIKATYFRPSSSLVWPLALTSESSLLKIAPSCLPHSWIYNFSDFSSSAASLQGFKPINWVLVAKFLPFNSSFYNTLWPINTIHL